MSTSTTNTAGAGASTPKKSTPSGTSKFGGAVSFLRKPELAILPVLVVVIIAGGLLNSSFLSYDNIFGVLQQASELAVLVMGLTLVLITGKFDLSLESTFGLAPMVGAYLFLSTTNGGLDILGSPILAIIAIFVVGAFIGLFNGFLVVYLKFNAFIATLATLILLRGVSLGLTKGETLSSLPPEMTVMGQSSFAGVPTSFVVAIAVFVVLTLFLTRHRAGRMLYAVGGNQHAARVAGVRVERIVLGVFIVAGMLAALAGLLQVGRIASIPASLGQNLIFSAFAAAVLGGVSLNGGKGTMAGACGGVLLLVLIQNVLILSAVPGYWIDATTGGIILVALLISRLTGNQPPA
ncbi:ABC transporter permease [Rhodococcoides fascians]|uniref:ABC transporter permease n=1 Tax=Rhodococcoides fascians TaxID=1828 RepID=UPI000690EA32|nr:MULTISPECIES: ABC transporter permease [Rhodococcus]OZF01286.1 ABC transporter permease [Rhodococcus sp. 15-1189-1-1a]OZF15457.1 ABC transporter permease [Rhodococcus sp. 14-2686-1-2]